MDYYTEGAKHRFGKEKHRSGQTKVWLEFVNRADK